MVEKHTTKGGTCLNVGCIPSKALLDSSEHFHNAYKHFKTHGIDMSELKLNWPQMVSRKDKVVEETCASIDSLMKKGIGAQIDILIKIL